MELALDLQQALLRGVPRHRATPRKVWTSVVADGSLLGRQPFQQPPAKADQLRARYLRKGKQQQHTSVAALKQGTHTRVLIQERVLLKIVGI